MCMQFNQFFCFMCIFITNFYLISFTKLEYFTGYYATNRSLRENNNNLTSVHLHTSASFLLYPICILLYVCYRKKCQANPMHVIRAVASLTVTGGQGFYFPNFSLNPDQFFLFVTCSHETWTKSPELLRS